MTEHNESLEGLDDNNAHHRLRCAIRRRESSETILKLIESYPLTIQQLDNNDEYVLHDACCYGSSNIVIMKLIELFPDAVKKQNRYKHYPLYIACRSQYGTSEYIVMKLIEIFPIAACTKIENNPTVLHQACRNLRYSLKVVSKLIEVYPLALQQKDGYGNYPIHCVIDHRQHRLAVMKYMMEIDPFVMQRQNNEGVSPLHLACMKKDIHLVEYIVQHSSDVLINMRDMYGETALHYVCKNGYDTVVDKLIQHPDIDLNAKNIYDEAPLHKACWNGMYEVVQKLLQHPRIDVNVCKNYYKYNNNKIKIMMNETPLHMAVLSFNRSNRRNAKVVQILLNHPFILINNTKECKENKTTPLDLIKQRIIDDSKKKKKVADYLEINRLLEDFSIKRRLNTFHYLFKTFIHS